MAGSTEMIDHWYRNHVLVWAAVHLYHHMTNADPANTASMALHLRCHQVTFTNHTHHRLARLSPTKVPDVLRTLNTSACLLQTTKTYQSIIIHLWITTHQIMVTDLPHPEAIATSPTLLLRSCRSGTPSSHCATPRLHRKKAARGTYTPTYQRTSYTYYTSTGSAQVKPATGR